MTKRFIGTLLLCGVFSLFPTLAAADTQTLQPQSSGITLTISGTVVDSGSGLPLPGVGVSTIGPVEKSTVSDQKGLFAIHGLQPGTYNLQANLAGFQPAQSEDLTLALTDINDVVIAIQRVNDPNAVRTIARTTVRATRSLQSAAVIYRQVTAQASADQGYFRAADFLRALPSIDNNRSDTAAPGDDVTLNIRGIGTLETASLLDGHPTGQGISGGYNYSISPIFGLRDLQVVYGSGSDFYGVDAIGGVVDQRTLDPTIRPEATLTQGWGTFDKLISAVQGTGTINQKVGYAFAFGVQGIDGPFHHLFLYQPAAAFDQSATDPAVRALAIYDDDTSVTTRSGLMKFRVALGPKTQFTTAYLASTFYDNKTGNGDSDFLPMDTALAQGALRLANKSGTDPCPAGTFTATNANGAPNGTGPTGAPDGGFPCQTPQQWANFNAGWQGAGLAFQTFKNQDVHDRLETALGKTTLALDGFSNVYLHHYDRSGQLPFHAVPNDNSFTFDEQVTNTGFTLSDDIPGNYHDFGIGFFYNNSAYLHHGNGAEDASAVAHENAIYLKDAYNAGSSPLTTYANLWFKHSTITNTSYVDPRIALVWREPHDVIRVAAGASSAQPYLAFLNAPFTPVAVGSLNGTITCAGPNSIGNAPSSLLKPERGVDEDVSWGHRFWNDSQVQITAYNTNVFDKIYSLTLPLTQTGTSFIDPATLALFEAKVGGTCGSANILSLLGVSGNVNIGHVQAKGINISGVTQFSKNFYSDYDWTVQQALLITADPNLLVSNFNLVPGSQLPFIPLHKYTIGLDYGDQQHISARWAYNYFAENNAKNRPAYNYSTLEVGVPVAHGRLAIAVNNLFNQFTDYRGLIGEGFPLALNQFGIAANNAAAAAGTYTPLTGTQSTEQFGLPFRTIDFMYTIKVK